MKITLQRLSTKDLATLAERVINSSNTGKYTVVKDNELLAAVVAQYAGYDKVYSKLTFSGKGVSVAAADKTRDNLFGAMKMMLKSYEKLDKMPTYQPTMTVLGVFQMFGLDIDKLTYAEETAQMKKLIEALSTEEMTANLETLHLTDIFAQLKQAQANFEELYAEQAEANADLRALPSATASRKNLENALRDYFSLLTAMKSVPTWQMLYQDINEIVKGSVNSNPPTPPNANGTYKPMNPPSEE